MTFTTNNPDAVSVNSFQFLKDLMRENGLTADQVTLEQFENGFTVIVNKSDTNYINFTKTISGTVGKDVLPEEIAELDKVEAEPEKDAKKGILAGIKLMLILLALKSALEDHKGEVGVIPTQFDNESMDYNKYIGTIASMQKNGRMSKNVAEAITQLATLYATKDENGDVISWDKDKYKKFLNRIAGDQSELNKHELISGLERILADMRKAAKANAVEKQPQTNPVVTNIDTTEVRAEQEEPKEFTPEPNYNKGNRHTWQGIIKTIYGDWNSHSEYVALVHALKDANSIKYGDNVIPANLYFPEDLFNDGKRISKLSSYGTPTELEKAMKKNDVNVRPSRKAISNGAHIRTIMVDGKWRGIKEWYRNGQLTARNQTGYVYNSEETAKQEAKKLQKPE